MWDRVMRIIEDCHGSSRSLLTLKRKSKGAELVGDHSNRPNILLRDVQLFICWGLKNLGGHILDGAFSMVLGCTISCVIWSGILCQSKIAEMKIGLSVRLFFYKDIGRL